MLERIPRVCYHRKDYGKKIGRIMKGYFLRASGTDTGINLAVEEYLLRLNEELKSAILYLWQNKDTVVIGRNQNAYNECNVEYACRNGIKIVRRLTGGGAVYHDLGNLNYSMILPVTEHDIIRSTGVIVNALKSLGIEAKATGRNDICINDRKISGNAYYTNDLVGLHHGTVLYRADSKRMEAVLNVSEKKLAGHGIASVRSRVCDIASIRPDISLEDVCMALRGSFKEIYGIEDFNDLDIPFEEIKVLAERYGKREWNLDKVTGVAGSDAM